MPKILKSFDGRMWMINVDGSPTDSMDGHWQHRIIDFQWYESGDYTNEEDLYESGLSNVSSEFWGKMVIMLKFLLMRNIVIMIKISSLMIMNHSCQRIILYGLTIKESEDFVCQI